MIRDWDGLGSLGVRRRPRTARSRARSNCGCRAMPIAGTLAERYLAETRRIDVAGLPANISDRLRFHRPLPVRTRAASDPACSRLCATQRATNRSASTASRLSCQNGRVCKVDRFALGRIGAVKLWPSGSAADRRRGARDHARGRHPHSLPRRAAAAGLVGGLERWIEPVPGHSRGRAADHPGRPRWQR